jgi:hypothetical protein
MKSLKVFLITFNIINLHLSEAAAYSLRTAYEDATNADPEAQLFVVVCALIAYPFLLFACRFKLNKPKDCSEIEFWKLCIKISAKQLLPLIFLIYVAGGFVLLFFGILFTITGYIVLNLTDGNNFFRNLNSLYFILKTVFFCWYIFSVFISVKWLPKNVGDEMLL